MGAGLNLPQFKEILLDVKPTASRLKNGWLSGYLFLYLMPGDPAR